MTRKDFNAIAAALKASNAPLNVVEAIADVCAQSNSRFNCDRFIEASTND